MVLSNEQIKEIVKSQPHQQEIQRGIFHQNRLRFHSETVLKKDDFQDAYKAFTNWVGLEPPELLPSDKFNRFLQLLKPPFPTVELTESIYSKLFKVFFSQDSFQHYEFTNPELHNDWLNYKNNTFWNTKGFQAMQSAIDSVWVVDLPGEQITTNPAPFNRLINIQDVIDISNDEFNNCEYVIYTIGKWVIAYDAEFFRVYENRLWNQTSFRDKIRTTTSSFDIGDPIKEIPHGLGYTPARMFWSKSLDSQNFINKEAPITKVLSDLDWLLFHMTSKKYMDVSNSYPILTHYDDDDDSNDPDRTENKDRTDGEKRPPGNKLIGPGSIVKVPAPVDSQDSDLMKNAINLISPEVDTLEWHVTEEIRLKDTIFKSVVGTDTAVRNDAAKNQMQIEASFESRQAVLFNVKRNFEIINKFADFTIAKLRYGEQFIDCKIDYGTEFFLKTVEDLHNDRAKAKESGAGDAIISNITDKILNTEYKEDHASRLKAEIIRNLDPLPEKDLDESIQIFDKGGVDKINFVIKTNLLNFVWRFERENISLVEFAKDIDYAKKIDLIQTKFKEYAKQLTDESQQRPED